MKPDQLKAAREKLKLTQAELAAQLEVHRVTIAAWEGGTKPISKVVELALGHLFCLGKQHRSKPR